MKFLKHFSLALITFTGLTFYNLNSAETFEKELSDVDEVVNIHKHFKGEWFRFKSEYAHKMLELFRKQHDESYEKVKEYVAELAEAENREETKHVLHDLSLDKLKMLKRHAEQCHHEHKKLTEKARKIYHEEIKAIDKLEKEIKEERGHYREGRRHHFGHEGHHRKHHARHHVGHHERFEREEKEERRPEEVIVEEECKTCM